MIRKRASASAPSGAGAVSTATHGSGDRSGNLATAVAGLELVTSEGDVVHARRPEPRPEGAVVYRVDGVEADDDTDTPPFGIPVVEVAQLPDAEYERRADGS